MNLNSTIKVRRKNRLSRIFTALGTLSTIGAFVLAIIGYYSEAKKKELPIPQHLFVTRDILASVNLDQPSRRERAKIDLKSSLPEGFKISLNERYFDSLWKERWTIKNIGTKEIQSSNFFEKLSAKIPEDYEVVATTGKEFQIADNGRRILVDMDLLNPGEIISCEIIYTTSTLKNESPKVIWEGKLIGSSKIEYETNNYLKALPRELEGQLEGMKGIFSSKFLIWFSEWQIALFLGIFSVFSFLTLWLANRARVLRLRHFGWSLIVVLMVMAVSSSEVATYIILRRSAGSITFLYSIWLPIILLQIATWFYLARKANSA